MLTLLVKLREPAKVQVECIRFSALASGADWQGCVRMYWTSMCAGMIRAAIGAVSCQQGYDRLWIVAF